MMGPRKPFEEACKNILFKTVNKECRRPHEVGKPETLYPIISIKLSRLVYRMVDHYQPACHCCHGEEEFPLPGDRTAYVCRHCGTIPFTDGPHHDDRCPRHTL